jgi:hypothetical protein
VSFAVFNSIDIAMRECANQKPRAEGFPANSLPMVHEVVPGEFCFTLSELVQLGSTQD